MMPYERLKTLRKNELNLTQAEFAEKIGVTRAVIKNLELGIVELKDHMIKLICGEFNVCEEWLRNGNGEPFIELSRNARLMIWAADVLKDEEDSFRRGFVDILADLKTDDWITLAKLATLNLEQKDFETFAKISKRLNELSNKLKENEQKKE